MAGIRTSTVINVGTATLAAFIGGGGLGDFIFLGISRSLDALILLGAIPAALLAILLDYLLGAAEKWATPRGLK
ncbi:Glycine betaine/carnitine/choline transport system permease protein OpuCB [compost metagenome]